MAPAPTQVILDFTRLLVTMAKALGFPEPTYRVIDITSNNIMVVVKAKCKKTTHVFLGGKAKSLEESCCSACQKAVNELMVCYRVSVEDVTSNKWRELQRGASLYSLKKERLRAKEREPGDPILYPGPASFTVNDNHEGVVPGTVQVSVDYLSILCSVNKQFRVNHTLIEAVETAVGVFEAWCTVTLQGRGSEFNLIVGDPCLERMLSKQNVARKVIAYLMPLCNFEVIDANYDRHETMHRALMYNLVKAACQALRDRALISTKALIKCDALQQIRDHTLISSVPEITSKSFSPLAPMKRPCEHDSDSDDVPLLSRNSLVSSFKPLGDFEPPFRRDA